MATTVPPKISVTSVASSDSGDQISAFRRASVAARLRDSASDSPISPLGVPSNNSRFPGPVSAPAASAAAAAAADDTGLYMPKTNAYAAKDTIPNTPLVASMISAGLGALAGIAAFSAVRPVLALLGADSWTWARPQLGIYLAAMGLFHLLEFWTTAGWNYDKLSVDAFLLNNTMDYHIAHAVGLAEYFISSHFWPAKFQSVFASVPVLALAVGLLVAGQTFRSLAMVHAGNSFSHLVKKVKLQDHTLVTTGVYAYVRHPSYVGFFYWALATQVLLSNVVSTAAFCLVLGRFFGHRIKLEEVHLIQFFGDKYLDYRRKVGSGLPFLGV